VDISDFPAGSFAGVFRASQNLSLAPLVNHRVLFFLWLVESLLSFPGFIFDRPRFLPRRTHGPLPPWNAKARYPGAANTVAVWRSAFEGGVHVFRSCHAWLSFDGDLRSKNSAASHGCAEFYFATDGLGRALQQSPHLARHQRCQ
jgi:hypothetical protein